MAEQAQEQVEEQREDAIITYYRLAKEYDKKYPTKTIHTQQNGRYEVPRTVDPYMMGFLPDHAPGNQRGGSEE